MPSSDSCWFSAPDDPCAPICAPPVSELHLEDVHFHYGDGHDILHGVDLTIPAGKVVALVGESGSGRYPDIYGFQRVPIRQP